MPDQKNEAELKAEIEKTLNGERLQLRREAYLAVIGQGAMWRTVKDNAVHIRCLTELKDKIGQMQKYWREREKWYKKNEGKWHEFEKKVKKNGKKSKELKASDVEYKEAMLARAKHDMINAWIPDCFCKIVDEQEVIKRLKEKGPQSHIKTIEAEIKILEDRISLLKEERNGRPVVGTTGFEDPPFIDEEARELLEAQYGPAPDQRFEFIKRHENNIIVKRIVNVLTKL